MYYIGVWVFRCVTSAYGFPDAPVVVLMVYHWLFCEVFDCEVFVSIDLIADDLWALVVML